MSMLEVDTKEKGGETMTTFYVVPPHTYQERGKPPGEGFHGSAPARLYIDKDSDVIFLHGLAFGLNLTINDFDDNPLIPSYTLPTREHYERAKELARIVLPVTDLLPLIDRGPMPEMGLAIEKGLGAHLDEEYQL